MISYDILSTGSDGNAVVIEKNILVDCGVTRKLLADKVKDLKLVLLTHIHGDHFQPRTIKWLADSRPTLRFACCEWLAEPLLTAGIPAKQIDVLKSGTMYGYGICNVIPFEVKHNVRNCGWKIWLPTGKLIYCTDMNNLNGICAPRYDLYMIEANYDEKDIQERIAEKKVEGVFAYERNVIHNHMSKQKADDWLYSNMGAQSSYIYMHCHKDKEKTTVSGEMDAG